MSAKQHARGMASAVALLALGWATGLMSDDLLPQPLPRETKAWLLVCFFALSVWFVYFGTYYVPTSRKVNKRLLSSTIVVAITSGALALRSYAVAPTHDQIVKDRIHHWVSNIDEKAHEVEPLEGYLYSFKFGATKTEEIWEGEPLEMAAAMSKNTHELYVGYAIRLVDYTRFVDSLTEEQQIHLKRELDAYAYNLEETETKMFRDPNLVIQIGVVLDPETSSQTDFTAAANIAHKGLLKLRALTNEQIRNYGAVINSPG